jgi:hypothetical protein
MDKQNICRRIMKYSVESMKEIRCFSHTTDTFREILEDIYKSSDIWLTAIKSENYFESTHIISFPLSVEIIIDLYENNLLDIKKIYEIMHNSTCNETENAKILLVRKINFTENGLRNMFISAFRRQELKLSLTLLEKIRREDLLDDVSYEITFFFNDISLELLKLLIQKNYKLKSKDASRLILGFSKSCVPETDFLLAFKIFVDNEVDMTNLDITCLFDTSGEGENDSSISYILNLVGDKIDLTLKANSKDITIIDAICIYGEREHIQILLNKGIDIKNYSFYSRNPFKFIRLKRKYGKEEMISLLEEAGICYPWIFYFNK